LQGGGQAERLRQKVLQQQRQAGRGQAVEERRAQQGGDAHPVHGVERQAEGQDHGRPGPGNGHARPQERPEAPRRSKHQHAAQRGQQVVGRQVERVGQAVSRQQGNHQREDQASLQAEQRGQQQADGRQRVQVRDDGAVGDGQPRACQEDDEDQADQHQAARLGQEGFVAPEEIQPQEDAGRGCQCNHAQVVLPLLPRFDQPHFFERFELRRADDLAAGHNHLARFVGLDDRLDGFARGQAGGLGQFGTVQAVRRDEGGGQLCHQVGLLLGQR
jgi:hypothetical protein